MVALTRPSRARAASALLVLALLVIPATQAVPSLHGVRHHFTVDVLYADGGPGAADERPRLAAEEAVEVLAQVGGLKRVRLASAAEPDALLERVRASKADAIVVVAHGSEAGIDVGGRTVPWTALNDAFARSGARHVFVGACDAELLGEVPGKTVHRAFSGDVDWRMVGPGVADLLFREVLTQVDQEFEPRFRAWLDERGGLATYLGYVMAPTETLNCAQYYGEWYDGKKPSARITGCVYAMDDSPNCHSEAERAQEEFCKRVTPDGQQEWSRDSVASGDFTFFAACGAAVWECVARVLGVEQTADSGGTYYLRVGVLNACMTVSAIKKFHIGPSTAAWTDAASGMGGKMFSPPDMGVKLCGGFGGSYRPAPEGGAAFRGSGNLDLIGSTWAKVVYTVFRWTIQVGFEAGFKYPFKLSVEVGTQPCSGEGMHFYTHLDAEGGSWAIFLQATGGWGGAGWSRDLGGAFAASFTIHAGHCNVEEEPTSIEPGPALQRLVDAGLARTNGRPTPVIRGEDSVTYVRSMLVTLRPGTFAHDRYVASGALEPLGVPRDARRDLDVVVDLSHPGVQKALGQEHFGAFTPVVSLLGGVALLPAGVPVSDATDRVCGMDAGDARVVQQAACKGADPAKAALLEKAPSEGGPSLPMMACGNYHEWLAFPSWDYEGNFSAAQTAPVNCVEAAAAPYTEPARVLMCDGDGSEDDHGCTPTSRVVGKAGLVLHPELMSSIHNTVLIVDRPHEALTWLTDCVVDTDALTPGVGGCLTLPQYASTLSYAPTTVASQYAYGQALLGTYASAPVYQDPPPVGVPGDPCGVLPFQWAEPVYRILRETMCDII